LIKEVKTICTFLYGTGWGFARLDHARSGGLRTMSKLRFHAREAAAALLKMAKTTSDPKVAAGLIDAAASLKEQAGELPIAVSAKASDSRAGKR
jgi:hypothetical protein